MYRQTDTVITVLRRHTVGEVIIRAVVYANDDE